VLSRRLLQDVGLYDRLLKENVVTQTATSAMLVPAVVTGAADACLAYRTDTLPESAKIETVSIPSPLAKAVQPFAVARSSEWKQLTGRLLDAIRRSRQTYESAGFRWLLESSGEGAAAP
jgi:ABC-type molybdate transport system substrate-binding protein